MKTIRYMVAVLVVFSTGIVAAQPGWQDMTPHYNYTITDKSGREISFKADRSYTIRIDNVSYSGAMIPFDSLKPATPNTHHFDNYIRINDLSLRVPQANRLAPLDIQVIRGRDTMHLNQPVFRGDARRTYGEPTVRRLQFIPGHYHFPRWTGTVFDDAPQTTGSVRFVNTGQRNFIIPGKLYRAFSTEYDESQALEKERDSFVVSNFTKDYITVKRDEEAIKIEGQVHPYTKSWGQAQLFPTADSNVLVGLIQYKFDTINASLSKGVFARLNKKENRISHWLPAGNSHAFSTAYLYRDTFNGVLYNATLVQDMAPPCTLLRHDCPFTWKYFRSVDEGKTWTEDEPLQKLFDKHKFRNLEFLDGSHALGFTLTEKDKGKRSRYQQGTYYLIRDMEVADSLITPDKVHYNSNYVRYSFTKEGDTIRLGQWGIEGDSRYGETFFRPLLARNGGYWKFRVEKDVYKRPAPAVETETEYVNFTMVKNRELVFRNGSGSLALKSDITGKPTGYGAYVLEKGTRIYIVDNDNHITMLSFDAGARWYVYPRALYNNCDCRLPDIDDDYIISFFDLTSMQKVSYKFWEE